MKVAEVVVPVPINKTFYYTIPSRLENSEISFRRVKVPFGNRVLSGYILSVLEYPESEDGINFKDIIEVTDKLPVLNEETVKMAEWLSSSYLCSVGEALSAIVPVSLKIPKKTQATKTKKIKITNPGFKITKYQQTAFDEISNAINLNKNENFLLHGVTGSGKTEVYLRCIRQALDTNKSAIFLLPEISLTPQFINILNTRFGDVVALWHSGITALKKYKIFNAIQNGEVKIAVGARSAIFLPFTNLGLIIIDEEHETTYKQNNKPSYDSKEIALWRAKYNNAVTVFGSATPSLETYKKCMDKNFKLLKLPERIDSKPLPSIEMINLKDVKTKVSVFSKQMLNAIKKALARREQIIIFLNRRGFSPSIVCENCDTVIQCPECSVAMVYHKYPEHLECHYCGKELKFPVKCPKCGKKQFRIFGIATQRVEEDLKKIFPHTKIFRLDGDTAKTKDTYAKVYEGIKNEEYSILLGTQMVTKGFDFPRVSLVCVVDADTSLYLPDFRSSERTFQLLTQVAGRCGRSEIGGKVLVQTKYPENYALQMAQKYDYKSFYEKEMLFRKDLQYPPFCNIAKVTIRNKDDKKTLDFTQKMYNFISDKIVSLKKDITILGPSQSYIAKQNGTYRWQIILKGNRTDIKEILEELNALKLPCETFVNMELDPSDLL